MCTGDKYWVWDIPTPPPPGDGRRLSNRLLTYEAPAFCGTDDGCPNGDFCPAACCTEDTLENPSCAGDVA